MSEYKIRFKIQLSARKKDGNAVIANRSRKNNLIPRTGGPRIDRHLRQEATDASRRDVHAVGFTAFDNLCIPSNHGDACPLSSGSHRAHLRFKICRGQSFL